MSQVVPHNPQSADDFSVEVKFICSASMMQALDRIAYDRFSSRSEIIRSACRAVIRSEEARQQRAQQQQ